MTILFRMFLIMLPFCLCAGVEDAGRDNFDFLRLGHCAKPLSMGGAYTAAEGVEGIYWNPASIAPVTDRALMLSYRNYILDTQTGFPAVVVPLGAYGVAALQLSYFNGGEFYYTDQFGSAGGRFGYADYATVLSYAKRVFPYFDAGVSVKYLYSSIHGDGLQESSNGFALDLGGLYRTDLFKRLFFGFAVKDLGFVNRGFYRDGEGMTIPTTIKCGLNYKPGNLRKVELKLDAHIPLNGYLEYRTGFDFAYDRHFSFRGGYRISHKQVVYLLSFFSEDGLEEDHVPEQIYTWSMGCGMNFGTFLADVAVLSTTFQMSYEISVTKLFRSQ